MPVFGRMTAFPHIPTGDQLFLPKYLKNEYRIFKISTNVHKNVRKFSLFCQENRRSGTFQLKEVKRPEAFHQHSCRKCR